MKNLLEEAFVLALSAFAFGVGAAVGLLIGATLLVMGLGG